MVPIFARFFERLSLSRERLAREPGKHGRPRIAVHLRALTVGFSAFAVSTMGLLHVIEEPILDSIMRMRNLLGVGKAQVLLVDAGRDELAGELEAIVVELKRQGAVGVAVTSTAQLGHDRVERLLEAHPDVVLGVRPLRDPGPEGGLDSPQTLPTADRSRLGWVVPGIASASGVQRCQASVFRVGDLELPTVEWALASAMGEPPRIPAAEPCFRIDFRGDVGSLPTVSAGRVVSDGLIRELVADRWALIGTIGEDALTGLRTPTTRGTARMSLLEFQGHALDTLVGGRIIRTLPAPALALLFVLVAFACESLRSRVSARLLTLATLGLALGVVAAAVLSFASWRLWLPAIALVLEICVLFALATRQQVAEGEESVRRLLHGFQTRLRSLIRQGGLHTSDDPWTPIAELVRQTLELDRTIFLEAVPGDHRVKEIHAIDCSVHDIDERRRDYLRSPYRDALRKAGPLRLDRGFLQRGQDDECQYLVPLSFGNEILGFWALSAPSDSSDAEFERAVADYAGQISEILYQRHWLSPDLGEIDERRPRTKARSRDVYEALQWVSGILERRLLRAESLLRGLGSAVVVYDLFGRLLDVTGSMRKHLESAHIVAHDLTALDLVVQLARVPEEEARRHLSEVVREKATVSLPAYLDDASNATTLMLLSPIEAEATDERQEASPFGVLGVSLELLDTSSHATLSEVKSRLGERLGVQVERDLGEIGAALSVLRDPDLGSELRDQLLEIVDSKMTHLLGVVAECREYLSIGFDQMDRSRYPTDATSCLTKVVDRRSRDASRRGVDLRLGMPEDLGQVLAAPDEMERGLDAIVDFLLDDAEEGHPLWIRVEELESETAIRFSNRGYGFAQDKLEEILSGERATDRGTERRLAHLRKRVDLWGGTLAGRSDIGVGTQLELRLHRLKHV